MKKLAALLLAIVMVIGLVACGPKQPTQQTNPPASDPTKAPASDPTKAPDPTKEPDPAEPIELDWWINFGSGYEETLNKIVEAFNESQNKYHVSYVYQGSAPELLAKIQSSTQENLPDIFSGPGENIALYADADFCVPLQQFIDADTEGWPELESTWPGLRGGYKDSEGNQIGYPIGSSYAGLFYNATMMKEAGINPEEDIKSHEDLYEVAKKLVDEGYCKFGMGFHNNGFYFHGAIGREGLQLFNNNNGLTGERVTECLYTKDEKVYGAIYEMLDVYQRLHREDLVIPYDTSTQGEVIPAYAAGDCAMFTGVISYTAKVIKAVNGAFEIGFMALPSATEDGIRGGHPNSGTGSWIANTGDPEKMQGAYEFIKWTSKGEWAAMWAIQTGYLAPNEHAYNDPAYQDYLKNTFPAIVPLYESIAKDDGTAANPYIGVMDVMKAANKLCFATVCADPNSSIDDAIKAAEDTIQEALDLYNMAN